MGVISHLTIPESPGRVLMPETGSMPADQNARTDTAGHVPAPLRLAAGYIWRILLIGVGIYALARVLDFFSVLVVPVLIAVLLTALLGPLVELLVRWMPRGVAVLIAMLAGIGVVSGLLTLVGTQIASQISELTRQALLGLTELQRWLEDGPLSIGTRQLSQYTEQVTDWLSSNSGTIGQQALSVTATAGEVLAGFALCLFALIFLLLDGRQVWEWLLRVVPIGGRDRVDTAGRTSWVSLTAYVRATVLVAAADAVGIGIGALILGVPLAVPLAVLVFVGAFVPIVGAFISGAVAVLVALITLGPVKALIMLVIVIGVQQLESHVLQPFLMGRMVSIHPLGIVVAIGAGLLVDGIVGALFAVPLVAMVNTFVHSITDPTPAVGGETVPAAPGDDGPADLDQGLDHGVTPDHSQESAD